MSLFSDDEKVVLIKLNQQKKPDCETFSNFPFTRNTSHDLSSLLDLTDPSLLFLLSTPHIILFFSSFSHLLTSPALSFWLSTFQIPKVLCCLHSLHFLVSPPFFISLLSSSFVKYRLQRSRLIFPAEAPHHSFSLPSFIYFLHISSSISSFLQHHRICILLTENQTADLQLYSEWWCTGSITFLMCLLISDIRVLSCAKF